MLPSRRARLAFAEFLMRRRLLPLLLSTASLGAALSAGRGAANSDTQFEEETRALRQSLFKKPSVAFVEISPGALAMRPAERTPPSPKISRPIVIAPPPPPREISLAERELSLQPAAYTPYDRYSGSVRTVIERLDQRPATMPRANVLMGIAHDFRYRTASDPYRATLPETTASTRSGDCKAKSLWLYDQLGDPSALYVIGKTFRGAKSNHAWVYWRCDNRWWILDPTNRSTPVLADSLPSDRYIPYYSFGKEGAFRHRATWIFMAGSAPVIPAVASPGGKSRVAKK